MARDPLREEIEWLTRGIRAIRIARFGEGGDMALELKGLKSKALTAAGHIGRLNQAYDKFNEAAPAHAADVEGLLPQIEALGEDLAFAALVNHQRPPDQFSLVECIVDLLPERRSYGKAN